MPAAFATIDDYVASLPHDVQPVMQQIRRTIREALPNAEETIGYDIPSFRLNGTMIVQLAAWKKHVSLYPVPDGDDAFRRRIEPYRAGKGTLRFPLRQPVPLDLVTSIVTHLIAERAAR